jgi:hypothetical protein
MAGEVKHDFVALAMPALKASMVLHSRSRPRSQASVTSKPALASTLAISRASSRAFLSLSTAWYWSLPITSAMRLACAWAHKQSASNNATANLKGSTAPPLLFLGLFCHNVLAGIACFSALAERQI